MRTIEAWGLPHLTQSPVAALYNYGQMALSRFEACEIKLKNGSLRILPLDATTISIEGVSSLNTRRFLVTVTTDFWKLSTDSSERLFHEKLGDGDTALTHLTNAIRSAYRTGRIQKISNEAALTLRRDLIPRPWEGRGESVTPEDQGDGIVKAWATVDTLLQSPTATKRIERVITTDCGKIERHLLVTFQEANQRFILEMIPFPRPFDSHPTESITITKTSISHFDPNLAEPFSTQERALERFAEWISLWNPRQTRVPATP